MILPYELINKDQKYENELNNGVREVVFPIFRPLDAKIEHFRPLIRILREKSSLGTAGKLANPASRSKYDQNDFLDYFFINHIIGFFTRRGLDP